MRFVAVNRAQETTRRVPRRGSKPPQVIPDRNQGFVPELRNKTPLKRRKGDQRVLSIDTTQPHTPPRTARRIRSAKAKRGGDIDVHDGLHAVFLPETFAPAIFAVATGETLAAMNCQPSTRTGIARTKQNAAVADVNAIAPLRIAVSISGVSPPISAMGPRVSASSSPR